ncbi:MAG: helix-turn-helix transcriptional regulator [Treponema sp.]|nr:helix-turn-helix transcriptional regulator [Treponema sp.]
MDAKERLKALMKERGVTHSALAEMSGVKKRTIDGWLAEGKTFNPTAGELMKVAAVFGVSIDSILGMSRFSDNERFYSKYAKFSGMLERLEGLDPRSLSMVSDIIDVFVRRNAVG